MAELGTKPTPPTSPPLVPLPPTRNSPLNVPPAPVAAPTMTPEEIAAADEAEKAAQAQDLEDARAEEIESNTAMAALEGAFVPNGITRHRGVGPIQYETRRGLIKVFPGDLVCRVVGPTNPDAPPEEWVLDEDFIICSQAILGALLFSVPWRLFPDVLEYRAIRIGEERRAEPPPPELLMQKAGESNADFEKRKARAEEDRKRWEKKPKLPPKPTQLPAPSHSLGGPKASQMPAPPLVRHPGESDADFAKRNEEEHRKRAK